MTKVQNCSADVSARTPPQIERVHGGECTLPRFMCRELSRLDGTQQDIGTASELSGMSRRTGRRFRRYAKRLKKQQDRCDALGGINEVFNYHDLYKAGKKCCNGVRWK